LVSTKRKENCSPVRGRRRETNPDQKKRWVRISNRTKSDLKKRYVKGRGDKLVGPPEGVTVAKKGGSPGSWGSVAKERKGKQGLDWRQNRRLTELEKEDEGKKNQRVYGLLLVMRREKEATEAKQSFFAL